jgi:Tol biopolymer transport system component
VKNLISMIILLCLAPYSSAELVTELSSKLNDYNLNISSRYNTAVFARSEAHFNHAKVWQVDIGKKGNFKTPKQLLLGPEKYNYSDPMLSADGQTLLFISDRPLNEKDKATDYNIWQATWSGKQWKDIQPLSETINSNTDELGPEVHNGILYFSSARSGKLSLYQATHVSGDFTVTSYDSIPQSALSQSDLSFSPNGNIAVFWQSSSNKKDTVLMMQRRLKGKEKWSTPIAMPDIVQSTAYEFTPQFSPDGQWLYLASARKKKGYEKLNIYRFASEKIFPK